MKLHELKSLLKMNSERPLRLLLPSGVPVPVSFHVTEIGRVRKTFLDCGGRLHETDTCQLQAWVGSDEDHRLANGKMAGILDKARSFLPDDNVPVEVEYEDGIVSQYVIKGHSLAEGAIVLRLASKHTDCLAKERCGVPGPNVSAETDDTKTSACCVTTGCC